MPDRRYPVTCLVFDADIWPSHCVSLTTCGIDGGPAALRTICRSRRAPWRHPQTAVRYSLHGTDAVFRVRTFSHSSPLLPGAGIARQQRGDWASVGVVYAIDSGPAAHDRRDGAGRSKHDRSKHSRRGERGRSPSTPAGSRVVGHSTHSGWPTLPTEAVQVRSLADAQCGLKSLLLTWGAIRH